MLSSFNILGPLLTVVLTTALVLNDSASAAAESIQCWECDSTYDHLCEDHRWTGTTTTNIRKVNCANSQIGQVGDFVSRNSGGLLSTSIMTCTKQVGRDPDGKVKVTVRGCGIPGVSADECKTEKREGLDADTCVCKGDFCNGAGRTEILAAAGLGASLLVGLLYKIAMF